MIQGWTKNRRPGVAAEFLDNQLRVGGIAFPLTKLMTETVLTARARKSQLQRLGPWIAPKQAFFT